MAGLLQYLISALGDRAQAVPGVTVPMPDDGTAVDPAAIDAEAARMAAAARLGKRRAAVAPAAAADDATVPPAPVANAGPLPGMLMGGGGGISGQDTASLPGASNGGSVFRSPFDEKRDLEAEQAGRAAAAGRVGGRRRTAFTGLNNAPLPFAGLLEGGTGGIGGSGLQNPMSNPTSATGEAVAANAGGAPAPTPAAASAAFGPPMPADLPPSTNDPMSSEPQVFADGVPLPRPRPISAQTTGAAPMSMAPDSPDLPPAAKPTGPALAPAAAESGGPFSDAFKGTLMERLGRLNTGLSNNAGTLMALGSGLAGAPSFGTGMRRGFAAAAPAMATDRANALKQSGISETFKALRDRGVPMQEALAAVYNPDVMKAVVAKHFETKPLQHVMVKDSLGNETPMTFDQNTGKYRDMNGKEISADGAGTAGISAAAKIEPNYDPETRRDEAFLKALDPITAKAVKDIADGKLPGSGRNLQKLLPLAARYENGFEANTYQRRQQLEKSYYGGGEGGKQLRSANTVIDHGIKLQKVIEDLHNFETLPSFLNPITGKVAAQYDKKYQDALARFNTNAEVYARELDFALTGKSTVSGQQHIRDRFDQYGSPISNKAALQQTLEMLNERIGEHENTYRTGMAKNSTAPVFGDMLTKRDQLNQLLGLDTGAGVNAHGDIAPAPASILKPGASTTINGVTIKRLN